jgi:hypothetical protein
MTVDINTKTHMAIALATAQAKEDLSKMHDAFGEAFQTRIERLDAQVDGLLKAALAEVQERLDYFMGEKHISTPPDTGGTSNEN